MTITTPPSTGAPLVPAAPEPAAVEPAAMVTLTIDGIETTVAKGSLVIRAAEDLGISIPRFCDHPLLAPAGACRQCMVEMWLPGRDGNLAKFPKPQPSCAIQATEGMQIKTQYTSPEAEAAQRGVMELILINHPLDCPICDKGGECPLQNQAMSSGRTETRFDGVKRTYAKPISVSTQILLDRERCILCQRCTRFSEQIAGDKFIDLQMRGARQQIGSFDTDVLDFAGELSIGPAAADASGRSFASYFSGNTVQICPVGALTSAAYRFRSRPFDLVSVASVAEHDSMGSAIRVDHRRGTVLRRLAGDDPEVNQEWITDKDRFAYTWQTAADRITVPMVRSNGVLQEVSWAEAFEAAAKGLNRAVVANGVGVLPGGRLTLEDAYAYAKFARVSLATNDIDYRSRPSSTEEEAFLGSQVAGRTLAVTFADLAASPHILLVGLEPEEEGGILFLRLREKVLAGSLSVTAVTPWASRGVQRLHATVIPAVPSTEAEVLDGVKPGADDAGLATLADHLAQPGAVILVGERLAMAPGALSAAIRLAERTGASLGWVPRRAGERGAIEAGALPGLLAGGRPVNDADARAELATVWGVDTLPETAGRDSAAILDAVVAGDLSGLVVGGIDPADFQDPAAVRAALEKASFLVSLEVRRSEVSERADVVLPIAPPAEKPGTFVTWEGRPRPFSQVLTSRQMADHRVLDLLANAMDRPVDLPTLTVVHQELEQVGGWSGARTAAPDTAGAEPATLRDGQAVLATWHQLIDGGRGQDGEQFLAGTAKATFLRVSEETAQVLGLIDGGLATVKTEKGELKAPVKIVDMVDNVVWLPTNASDCKVRETLGAVAGDIVAVAPAPNEEVQV